MLRTLGRVGRASDPFTADCIEWGFVGATEALGGGRGREHDSAVASTEIGLRGHSGGCRPGRESAVLGRTAVRASIGALTPTRTLDGPSMIASSVDVSARPDERRQEEGHDLCAARAASPRVPRRLRRVLTLEPDFPV